MIQKYCLFLSRGSPYSPFNHFKAFKHTTQFYRQRKVLKARYRLRMIDVPYLFILQQKKDYLFEKSLLQSILSQKSKEEKEKLQKALEQENKITSKLAKIEENLTREKGKFHEEGASSYFSAKLRTAIAYLNSKRSIEFVSKWVVAHVNLYHKALEEMVEGHREVTRNHDTVLEDGKKVSEKIKEFEEKLNRYSNNH